MIVAAGAYATITWGVPEFHYQYGRYLLRSDRAAQAKETFLNLGDYRDAPAQADDAEYQIALSLLDAGDESSLLEAQERLLALSLPEAAEQEREARYRLALLYREEKREAEAETLLLGLSGYKEADAQAQEVSYALALAAMESGEYGDALKRFRALPGYEEADEKGEECTYALAGLEMEAGAFARAAELFGSIPDYEDAAERARGMRVSGRGRVAEGRRV